MLADRDNLAAGGFVYVVPEGRVSYGSYDRRTQQQSADKPGPRLMA